MTDIWSDKMHEKRENKTWTWSNWHKRKSCGGSCKDMRYENYKKLQCERIDFDNKGDHLYDSKYYSIRGDNNSIECEVTCKSLSCCGAYYQRRVRRSLLFRFF